MTRPEEIVPCLYLGRCLAGIGLRSQQPTLPHKMADQHSLSGGLERPFNKRPTQWVRFIVTTSDKRQVVKINALGCMGLMVQDATTNLA